jgi:RHS repeat-associated protein
LALNTVVGQYGNIVNGYKYDEWGNITEETKDPVLGIDNPIRYAGEYYDLETNLYYLRARYYDPTTGRFISKDSYEGKVTNPLSLNLYTYCENNPVNRHDPSGHASEPGDEDEYDFGEPPEAENREGTYDPEGLGTHDALREVDPVTWREYYDPANAEGELKFYSKRTITNWISSDKYVGQTANAIDAKYPGKVVDVNKIRYRPDGTRLTDFDIELDNVVIQVKSGSAKGLTRQIKMTVTGTSKEVIGYAPDLNPSSALVKDCKKQGIKVFTSLDNLLNYLKNK